MATTLENILGGGNKPVSPHTPPGFAPGMQGAAATPQQGGQAQNNATTQKPQTDTTAQDKSTKRDGIKAASISALIPKEELHVPDGAIPKQPQQPKRLSYEEMFRQLYPYKPPTQEELEKERKKQRREQIFAAIGDGISALSNLYFTTQYAPNMYSGRNTASQRVKDRWDKLAADRNANMTAYINGLMRARQADDAYNRSEREWERQLGIDKIKQQRDAAADARAEAKEKRDAEMHDLNKQLRNNQITKAEYEAKKAEVEARYAPQLEESIIKRNKAAAEASNASAGASNSRARYYDRGGSGGSKSKDLQDAYDYWMSLTDEQKKQYRDGNNRYRKVKTGTDDYDNPIFTNQYMDDDDDFIQMVWEQRQGWLRNQSSNGKKQINGFGSGNSGKKKIAGFGS